MTIDQMRYKKRELGYTYEMISELSGVPVGTIQKIFSGETSSPRRSTILALEQVFSAVMPTVYVPSPEDPTTSMVCDPEAAYQYKKQGDFTLDDYYAIPDDHRVELIDGFIYDMSSPTTFHQLIAGEVHYQITNYIREKGGSCTPFISPIDVLLDCDNKTMIQPDVIILCDIEKIQAFGIYGAPDFVLEVISPSTKTRDYGKKLGKYIDAGVREYWIVDPYSENILVYDLSSDIYPVIYSLGADIPVAIYGGDLKINLSRLIPTIRRLRPPKKS